MQTSTYELLLWICKAAYAAEAKAAEDRKRANFGDQFVPELLVMRKDKVRVEIRKENVGHHEPHLHVVHSDKIDASISLKDFSILAGSIDRKTHKYLSRILSPKQADLLAVWNELNENENSVATETLISNLGL
jgi:Domain of unknown function (DUF4160)